jgi:hypothetical protein
MLMRCNRNDGAYWYDPVGNLYKIKDVGLVTASGEKIWECYSVDMGHQKTIEDRIFYHWAWAPTVTEMIELLSPVSIEITDGVWMVSKEDHPLFKSKRLEDALFNFLEYGLKKEVL